jgi:hypothetical protein
LAVNSRPIQVYGELKLPEYGVRSTYSQAPFKISMHDLGGEISTATAFHYLYNEERFIVTNLHNVTGRNFFDGKPLNGLARTPMWIEVHTAIWQAPVLTRDRAFVVDRRRVEIYSDCAAQLDPLWLEHPELGPKGCDIVAIKDRKPAQEPEFMHNCVNLISDIRVPVLPGELAFVIGYPRGLKTGFGLPIWKSTFIASEPHYDVEIAGTRLPAFFLDGYTREGMSGSPVFARYRGMWDLKDPYKLVNPDEPNFWSREDIAINGSEGTEFIGIYSGRIPEKEGEAALGLCWRKDAIERVCSGHFASGSSEY